ncbi:hypothetical protein, partial [Candidatus Ichthyocystis sparus]|uniref:hypothetical protein n=1 Tax=Candidatus Ichthyocystis sparus TaxID=1561004 RepID=UPI00159ED0B7
VIPVLSMEALAVKALNEKKSSSVLISLLLKPDLVLVSSYEVDFSSIKEILSKRIMSKDGFRLWFEENYSPGSLLYGSGFLLICDDYDDICFHTENHTALDIYSVAKIRFYNSASENCYRAREICVDYATLPSALTLEEQINFMQRKS